MSECGWGEREKRGEVRGSREVERSGGEEKRRGERKKRKKWGMIDRDICLSSSSSVFCPLSISLSLHLSICLFLIGLVCTSVHRGERGREERREGQTDRQTATAQPKYHQHHYQSRYLRCTTFSRYT